MHRTQYFYYTNIHLSTILKVQQRALGLQAQLRRDNKMPENFILRQTKLELSKKFERHKRKETAMLECMYLRVLPERPHNDMLRSMREIAKEDN